MKYRVAQWATGNIGLYALREIIRHPSLELVGVLTYDPAKAGVDAGVLCGERPTGVLATRDRAAIHALRADCVLYVPRVIDVDELIAFLNAGTNVVSACVELYDGAAGLAEADRARISDACARTGASVYATGSDPGFITDTLPFALLSLERRVDSIEIDELANMSRRNSPEMLFDQIGFAKPPAAFDDRAATRQMESPPPIAVIARAAGLAVDRWTQATEVAAARQHTRVLAGDIGAGTVGALRIVTTGLRGREAVIRMRQCWYCTTDLDPSWEFAAPESPAAWRVRVHGDAPLDVAITFPVPLDDWSEHSPALTANPPVNAVPYVCAARPGILRTSDLPPITLAGP
jgi:4-hydroxy-tetrahydrodipicolinate reductase